MLDVGARGGREGLGVQTGVSGTTLRNLREIVKSGSSVRRVAREAGVSPSTITPLLVPDSEADAVRVAEHTLDAVHAAIARLSGEATVTA